MSEHRKPKIFVIYYSMHGHIEKMARHVLKGLERSGVEAKLFQVAETLSAEVLQKMHAGPKAADVPVITADQLSEADGFLFGVPTRFGSIPTQVRALLDQTGSHWLKGTLQGKFAGIFYSTGSLGGGQETTALTFLPFLVHQGINFVPLGYKNPKQTDITVVHGGSPWGAGTLSSSDGSRQPSDLELEIAETQGFEFGNLLKRVQF